MNEILLLLCTVLFKLYASPVSAESSLQFSMVVGGKRSDGPSVCTTDGAGNCYIIGQTNSPDFPFTTDDPDSLDYHAGNFIMKISSDGDILRITTPAFVSRVKDCMFDKTGNLLMLYYNGYGELILVRISPDGKKIFSSQIISDVSYGYGSLAIDESGRIYVAGVVESGDFPATPNAWQTSFAGGSSDAFIWVFSPDLETCEYATYFGGTENETIVDIEIDHKGYIHVVGKTISDDFPLTDNAIDNTLAHGWYPSGGFYAVFSPMFNELVFSTFLFNTSDPKLVVDSSGNGIITGLPHYRIPGAEHSYDSGVLYTYNILVLSIDPFTPAINYAAYLAGDEPQDGGPRSDSFDILVDSNDHPIAVGMTTAHNYPVTADAFQRDYAYDEKYYTYYNDNLDIVYDTVVTELDETGSSLAYSTYLGGGRVDKPRCATLDKDGNLWIAGQTESPDFPADLKIQYHEVFNEGDIFVCKFARNSSPTAVTDEPTSFHVNAPYPNPFNASVTIEYIIPHGGHVRCAVYDMLGRKVATPQEGTLSAGTHRAVWDGRDALGRDTASGTYFYRIEAAGLTESGKVMLVR